MPRLPYLEFVDTSLFVAYRAAAEPQDLEIEVATPAVSPSDWATAALRGVMNAANLGAAGSDVFPPSAGRMERLTGPWGPEALGPMYRWRLRVAAVAPIFLRLMVEELCGVAGNFLPIAMMRIAGTLPMDESALSVREDRVRAWVADREAFPREWPTPGFAIEETRAEGASIRVELGDKLTPDLAGKLRSLMTAWRQLVITYPSDQGQAILVDPMRAFPQCGYGKREMVAHFDEFRHARASSRAALVNMLARFHATVAPIAAVEIGL